MIFTISLAVISNSTVVQVLFEEAYSNQNDKECARGYIVQFFRTSEWRLE